MIRITDTEGESSEYRPDATLSHLLADLSNQLPDTMTVGANAVAIAALLPPGFKIERITATPVTAGDAPVAPVARTKRSKAEIASDVSALVSLLTVAGNTAAEIATLSGRPLADVIADLGRADVTKVAVTKNSKVRGEWVYRAVATA